MSVIILQLILESRAPSFISLLETLKGLRWRNIFKLLDGCVANHVRLSWDISEIPNTQEESDLQNLFFCLYFPAPPCNIHARKQLLSLSTNPKFGLTRFKGDNFCLYVCAILCSLSRAANSARTSAGACLNTKDLTPLDRTQLFACTSRTTVTRWQTATF